MLDSREEESNGCKLQVHTLQVIQTYNVKNQRFNPHLQHVTISVRVI